MRSQLSRSIAAESAENALDLAPEWALMALEASEADDGIATLPAPKGRRTKRAPKGRSASKRPSKRAVREARERRNARAVSV